MSVARTIAGPGEAMSRRRVGGGDSAMMRGDALSCLSSVQADLGSGWRAHCLAGVRLAWRGENLRRASCAVGRLVAFHTHARGYDGASALQCISLACARPVVLQSEARSLAPRESCNSRSHPRFRALYHRRQINTTVSKCTQAHRDTLKHRHPPPMI